MTVSGGPALRLLTELNFEFRLTLTVMLEFDTLLKHLKLGELMAVSC